MLRRTFLRLAAASPLALSSCVTAAAVRRASDAELEAALRRLVLAVGPWPEGDAATAEAFFRRFWSAVPVSGRYARDSALLIRLSERFPPGTHAARELDLAGLQPGEQDLLMDLADGLHGLFEIRAYVGREPTYGVCLANRARYVEAPERG